ncbi:hypothetical protein IQ235_07090 [Oscillatoriales cyanobacterium LEGE 11467]|uniref:Uncharacterized protein n=1 Tax=Zarconia navalis LEGE 11467 TaxID=1828826 RepID=A0A928VZJ6_9CYAN|nr:hypothetical protein [Zarconia navalis]MBE9040550.1 hypothetical protein [Zarconia navalis LEGE 11467]
MESGQQEYEFNSSQNQLLGDLAIKMRFVGMLSIALGGLSMFCGVVTILMTLSGAIDGLGFSFSLLIQGTLGLLVGLWTRKAARAFKLIVNTEGRDIENLTIALGELRKLYTLQYWLILIVFILFAGVILSALLLSLAGR